MAAETERHNLLRRIQETEFVALDLNLYLDTHPEDTKALEHYNKAAAELQVLMKKYEECYGPLLNFGLSSETGKTWRWINQPWPWDI